MKLDSFYQCNKPIQLLGVFPVSPEHKAFMHINSDLKGVKKTETAEKCFVLELLEATGV